MLQDVKKIDLCFYSKTGDFPGTATVFVESEEWQDERSLDWLSQKLEFYRSAMMPGGELTRDTYRNAKFKGISLYSRDPIPTAAQELLHKKKKEFNKFEIVLLYEYDPGVWHLRKKGQTMTEK